MHFYRCTKHGEYQTSALAATCPNCAAENQQHGGFGYMGHQSLPMAVHHAHPELEAAINNLSRVIEVALKKWEENSLNTNTKE